MNLLNLLNLPTPRFDASAVGLAQLCQDVHPDSADAATIETDVTVMWEEAAGGPPVLVIRLNDRERVELRLADALPFVSETIGVDIAAVFGQVAGLL